MYCVFTFKINGENPIFISLETDNGEMVLNNDVVTVLKDNPDKAKKIFELIENKLNGTITPVSYEDFIKEKSLIANSSVSSLRKNYPNLFPDGIEANVLLVNNIRVERQNISGRCINSNGEEIFVIENRDSDINKFANYLRTRENIKNSSLKIEDDDIKQLLKEMKFKDIKSLLLDFIDNESKYLNKTVNNKNCYRLLIDISRQFLGKPEMRTFGNSILDNIYPYLYKHDVWEKNKKGQWVNKDNLHTLDISFLYNLLCVYDQNILIKNDIFTDQSEKSLKQFKEFITKSNFCKSLFDNLKKDYPQFNFVFNKIGKHKNQEVIFMQAIIQTVKEQYGWTYDTIKTFDIQETYKGYQIYCRDNNGIKEYYVTQDYMTEDSYAKYCSNLEDAKAYIDNKISYIKIPNHNYIEFHYLNDNTIQTKQKLIPGSIVEVLDYKISKPELIIYFPTNEQAILQERNSSSFSDFEKIVDSWNINDDLKNKVKEEINTPEKVTLFLYDLQNNYTDKRNTEEIKTILKKIQDASKKERLYYYIDEQISNNKYRIIRTNISDIETYKSSNQNVPNVTFLEAIAKGIQEKIPGITIHIETAEQLKEIVPEANINTTRAFIKNGEIYLNSTRCKATDLVHEYMHLILGMLRSDPTTRKNYEQLLYRIISSKEAQSALKRINQAYPNISEMDKYEEVFVDLFSNYFINNNLNIFDTNEIKKLTETIFGQKIDDINQFYTGNVSQVFIKFNKDIASWLSNDNNISWEKSKTYRQLSNYISEQIKKGEIKEACK